MDVDCDTNCCRYVMSTDSDGGSMMRKRVDANGGLAGNKLVAFVFYHALLG